MKLLKIECEPFTRMEYVNKTAEQRWADRFRRCSSIISDIEIALVEQNCREATTLLLPRNDIEHRQQLLAEQGLRFTPVMWVKKFNGFSHRHDELTEDHPDAVCYGVVTRTETAAIKFKEATLLQNPDHDIIGGLLGYPACCRNFFTNVWCAGFVDPIWQQAENTGGEVIKRTDGGYEIKIKGYPECVAHQRSWGVRAGFHLPCSFTCEDTRRFANVWLETAEKLDPGASAVIMEILSLPSVWDAHKGVAMVNTPYYRGISSSVPCADVHTVYFTPLTNR